MARKRKTKTQIKNYLRDKGHKTVDVNREMDNRPNDVDGLLALHGVNEVQYRIAGGKKQ